MEAKRLRLAVSGMVVALGMVFTAHTGVCSSAKAVSQPKITRELVKEVEQVGTFLWLELRDGKQYLISSDGRFVIERPRVYDQQNKQWLTSIKDLKKARKPNVKEFAFFYLSKQGKPEALIVVDEYCPFCERLMKDLLALLKSGRTPKYDLAVTFFPIHREAIDASCKLMGVSPKKAKEIYEKWVESRDPSVWDGLTCDSKKRQAFLIKAAKLRFVSGINSTPVVVLPDGTKVIGYRNPESFLFEPLAKAEKPQASKKK